MTEQSSVTLADGTTITGPLETVKTILAAHIDCQVEIRSGVLVTNSSEDMLPWLLKLQRQYPPVITLKS